MYTMLKMVRLRAGFYVTRDAQWRIVRRKSPVSTWPYWHVERWSAGEQRWERVTSYDTLAACRGWLDRELALNAWGE